MTENLKHLAFTSLIPPVTWSAMKQVCQKNKMIVYFSPTHSLSIGEKNKIPIFKK